MEQYEIAFRLSPRDAHVVTWYSNLALAAFIGGRVTEAVDWAQKSVQASPNFPGGPRTLAASYGDLGQIPEARAACEKFHQLLPHATIVQQRESLPYFRDTEVMERYLDGLRKAGLPEGSAD